MEERWSVADSSNARAAGLTTILLAVDDYDAGNGAIKTAIELAADTGAELVVLSVLPVSEGLGLMGLDAQRAEEDSITSMVDRIAADARAGGVNARAQTTRGSDPAEAIVKVGRELKADVIVVGRRGRSDLARAMLGDMTARVIGASSSPVLVVPRAGVISRHRILLASDGSPASERATRTAALCAKLVRLPVTVLSVEVPEHTPERQGEAMNIVERTVLQMHERGIDATGKVARGTPPDEIIRCAAEANADLIVIGSEGRSGLGRVMLGGNCQAVIGKSTCPVLVTTAQMIEFQAPRTRPPKAAETAGANQAAGQAAGQTSGHTSGQTGAVPPRRTFLVVADDTPDMPAAIDYACRRAHATGGTVALLRVMAATDNERAVREGVGRIGAEIERMLGERPAIHLKTGDPSQHLLELLRSEPSINAVILAASADPRGSASLIIDLMSKHAAELPVPIMVVPGHTSGPPGGRRP